MRLFIVLLVGAVAVGAAAGVAAADEHNGNETDQGPTVEVSLVEGDRDDSEEPAETIDQNTALVSADYDGERAILVIESERPQSVTITDAAAVLEGGRVPRERIGLREGTNKVVFPASSHRGTAAVTIDTGRVLYAVPVKHRAPLISGPWSSLDVQLSAIAGLSSAIVLTGLIAWRRKRGAGEKPEVIA